MVFRESVPLIERLVDNKIIHSSLAMGALEKENEM